MALPPEIDDSETIVRGMCSPWHVSSKGKIKPEAFEPTPGTDEVSVMRHDFMGSDQCKVKALELEDLSKNKVYRGLAALSAGCIRKERASIVDSPQHFEGHADVKLGYVITRGEPLPPDQLFAYRAITKALANAARYFEDPEPKVPVWTGGRLEA